MTKCLFYLAEGSCKALREMKCEGCRFAKTQEEFYGGLKKAEDILKLKGLEMYKVNENGVAYIRVRRKK